MVQTTIDRTNSTRLSLAQELKDEVGLNGKLRSILDIRSGNKWLSDASSKPVPESLYMNIWFEHELCILFADTGLGKSVLSVQIGVDIAKTQKVLLIDFELSDKQFEKRYSNDFKNHYQFPENFLRAEINQDEADYTAAGFGSFEDYVNHSIEQAVITTDAKVLIVDNITFLRCETEKAREALPLMKHLIALKKRFNLSLLVLAHTPKRNLSQPITRNDLQGSKMLINFCDSAFALGESALDKNLRYLKQIKYRSSESVYDADNVAVFELNKPDNFLMFTPVHTSCEHEHLRVVSKEDKEAVKSQIIELNSKGRSYRDIVKETGMSLGYISKVINSSRS